MRNHTRPRPRGQDARAHAPDTAAAFAIAVMALTPPPFAAAAMPQNPASRPAPAGTQESTQGSAQDSIEERLKKLEQLFADYKDKTDKEKSEMRARIDALQKQLQDNKQQLESQASRPDSRAVDDAIAELQTRLASTQQRQSALEATRGQSVAYLNFSFDLLTAAGTSQATDQQLKVVQPGGHDPNQRGFTIQNAELALEGAVDPNFVGKANIVWQIDSQGETNVELEEAFLQTTSLDDFQFKAGQYLTDFGRFNRQHPHEWETVDETLVNNRMFGADGLRGPGAQLSWLAPASFFLELQAGIQNARGETQTSFFGNEDTAPPVTASGGGTVPGALGGHPFSGDDVKNLGDMLYTQRIAASVDLDDESTILGGASGALGPNSTGSSGNTQIFGFDGYYKWKSLASDQGWPFVKAQSEVMWRRYHADSLNRDLDGDGINEVFPSQNFRDWGMYAQLVYGFARPWTAAMRFDYVDGDGASTGGAGNMDRRYRFSPVLTYYPTEFSRIRLQSNIDKVQELGDRTFLSIWLQFEILFGQHSAHKF
jgi:Skp family chaperone for outer membrane proteins